jgi:sugar phosphate isomerase/epimerase
VSYSISTWNYLKPFGDRARLLPTLRQMAASGLGVELWLDWSAEPELLKPERWPVLREALRGVPCLSAHSRLVHFFDLGVLEEELQLCAFLEASPLVVHPRSLGLEAGTLDAAAKPGVFDKAQRELLRRILRRAASRGVRLALENGPMDLLAQVLEAVDGLPGDRQLGICIDTGHANLHRDLYPEPAVAFLHTFASRLVHLHLSDNGGQADDHAIPGRGTIDWQAVARTLAEGGFRGPVVLELWTDSPEQATQEAAAFLDPLGFAGLPLCS